VNGRGESHVEASARGRVLSECLDHVLQRAAELGTKVLTSDDQRQLCVFGSGGTVGSEDPRTLPDGGA
jgi:hypothetical protein